MSEMHQRLTESRRDVVLQWVRALTEGRVVGIGGESQTGKSFLMSHALARIAFDDRFVVPVDLDGAYSPKHLAWRWIRAVARAVIGEVGFSHLESLDRAVWPNTTRERIVAARELLGDAWSSVVAASPPTGIGGSSDIHEALVVTQALCRIGPTVVVLDHLEAPLLTPRHPVDPDELLWQLRSVSQHEPGMSIGLVSSAASRDRFSGSDSAFFGDGVWFNLERPDLRTWTQIAERDLDQRVVRTAVRLTNRHLPSTLAVLERLTVTRDSSPEQVFGELASSQAAHTSRAIAHANTLHRLGGHLVRSVASGQGPYEATPDAPSKDVARALTSLAMAGLLTQPAPKKWAIVDPFVARELNDEGVGGPSFRVLDDDRVKAVYAALEPSDAALDHARLRFWRDLETALDESELGRHRRLLLRDTDELAAGLIAKGRQMARRTDSPLMSPTEARLMAIALRKPAPRWQWDQQSADDGLEAFREEALPNLDSVTAEAEPTNEAFEEALKDLLELSAMLRAAGIET